MDFNKKIMFFNYIILIRMFDCSFCFKSFPPQHLKDANFDKYHKGLENLCPDCYELHRKYYFQKNSIMDDLLDSWKKGKCKKQKGNNTFL